MSGLSQTNAEQIVQFQILKSFQLHKSDASVKALRGMIIAGVVL